MVKKIKTPYRVDIAGSWGDHPFLNSINPTSVICARITGKFRKGMGLSGSTRHTIDKNRGKSLEYLFFAENQGKPFMSGSQDLLGIILPGAKMLKYNQSYWPNLKKTKYLTREESSWLESVLYLVPTFKRPKDLNVIGRIDVTKTKVRGYNESTQRVWKYIKKKDAKKLGEEITFNDFLLNSLMPHRINTRLSEYISDLSLDENILGYKICGAGGGGYLLVVSEKPVKGGEKFKII